MIRTFAEYLAERTAETMGAMDGTLMELHAVDMADWEAWIDPSGNVQSFDGYYQRTDYVPSDGLIYAVQMDRPQKWGSGETWTEAMADALTA